MLCNPKCYTLQPYVLARHQEVHAAIWYSRIESGLPNPRPRPSPSPSPNQVHAAIWYSRIESGLALLVSFLINLAVVLAFWRHFYRVECAAMEGGPFVCVG